MQNRRNYYRILHVQPDAPAEIIRSSYRALMLQMDAHPDRGGDHRNAALINEAYSVVSDPDQRQEYDRQLASKPGRNGSTRAAGADRSSGPSPPASPAPEASGGCVFCQSSCGVEAMEHPESRCEVCRSPLSPVGGDVFVSSGQRAVLRVATRRKIRVFTDWPQAHPPEATLRDVSPRGLRFTLDEHVGDYQIVKVDAGPLQATGRVARCTRLGALWTVGVEYFTLWVQPGGILTRRG
ncbi:MAG: DnaJ domain-containing protein [bacterium]|nr:DnaJ domain-containing protein [bacterium]